MASLCVSAGAEETVERELAAIRNELQALRLEVAEQGRMIRDLYEFADSEIDFKEEKKKREEKTRLLLDPVWETNNKQYTDRAVFSPRHLSFAVISHDGAIYVHNLDGTIERVFGAPEETITALAYSSDGSRILAGTKSGNMRIWDLERSESQLLGKRTFEIARVAWLGETDYALIESALGEKTKNTDSGELYDVHGELVDTKTGKTLWSFTAWQHLDYQNIAPSPDGNWVAVFKILGERGVYLLDATDGSVRGMLINNGLSVAIAPDSQLVAVGTPGISLWDRESGQRIRGFEGHSNWVVSLAFSPDGKKLVSGSGDSTARIWDVETGIELGRIRFPGMSTYVGSVSFSSDGQYVLCAAEGGRIVVAKTPPLQRSE
jgi:WD40 repeat protein